MQNTANCYRLSIKLIYYKKIIVFRLYICYTLRKKKEYKKRKYKKKRNRERKNFLKFLDILFYQSNNIFIFATETNRKIGKTDKSQKNGRTKKRVGRCTPGRGAQKERADPRDNRHKRKQIVCRYAQTSCR